MTNMKYTDITAIIDKSGSMAALVMDTIGGFNTFLEKQQETAASTEAKCILQVIQFDDNYEPGAAYPVKDHPALTRESYVPRGMTALLDAIGRSINAAGVRFKGMVEKDRPGKVLFVVITDGFENHSTEFTSAQINAMITAQQDKYEWDFVYLGANQDAWAVGSGLGFKAGKVMSTAANSVGTRSAYMSTANYASASVGAMTAEQFLSNSFSAKDADAQTAAGVDPTLNNTVTTGTTTP